MINSDKRMVEEMKKPVVIVGGGVAGLQAAFQLHQQSISYLLIEKMDRVGGRVQSDVVNGFILDHGFQVLQTSYPGVQQNLDLTKLNLSYFQSGANLYQNGSFYPFFNPLRNPFELFKSVFAGIFTLGDLVKLAQLWLKIQGDISPISANEKSVAQYLLEINFSKGFYEKFIFPFFAGVFLDANLSQSASLFDYFLKQFLEGNAALPSQGIGQVANQLSERLNPDCLMLGKEIVQINAHEVILSSGEYLEFSRLILACDAKSASQLLNVSFEETSFLGAKTFYFSSDEFPDDLPLLNLIPKNESSILHFSCLSNVCANYAPLKKKLISVTSLNHGMTDEEIALELVRFTGKLKGLTFLKSYFIPYSLPKVGFFEPLKLEAQNRGFKLVGDYLGYPSLQSALEGVDLN